MSSPNLWIKPPLLVCEGSLEFASLSELACSISVSYCTPFFHFGLCTLDFRFGFFFGSCILLVSFTCIAFVNYALDSFWASLIYLKYLSVLLWTDALVCGVCAMHGLCSWWYAIEILWSWAFNLNLNFNCLSPMSSFWLSFCSCLDC